MKKVWVSIRRLKQHEFRTTLRHIKNSGTTWHDIYTKLGVLQNEALRRTTKQASGLLIAYLLISSLGDASTVSVTFGGISASVPTAFVAVVASATLFVVLQGLQTVLMLVLLRSAEGTRIRLHGFSSNAYGLYHQQDESALTTPVLLNSFMREQLPGSSLLMMTSRIIFMSVFLPLIALGAYLFEVQLEIFQTVGISYFYKICSAFGLFVLVATATTLLLFNLPIPMTKNPYSIRWGFLTRLYPIGTHPRVNIWLDEENK